MQVQQALRSTLERTFTLTDAPLTRSTFGAFNPTRARVKVVVSASGMTVTLVLANDRQQIAGYTADEGLDVIPEAYRPLVEAVIAQVNAEVEVQ